MRTTPVPPLARTSARSGLQVLDPCTLGRPIHLLNGFTAALAADLRDFFSKDLNRRYGAAFEVAGVSLERGAPLDPTAPRWLNHANEVGSIGFALERSLLLRVMAYRYGQPAGKPPAGAGEPLRETATEERLATNLGLRLVQLLAARIEAPAEPAAAQATGSADFRRVPAARMNAGTWTLRVEVHEPADADRALMWFTLDEAWMARLLRRLSPVREKSPEATRLVQPLSTRLQLTLTGRLLQKELPLGALMDLRVGDVIPISMGATDVLVDDSKLFTATVAEHKGKLCLTSFEFVE
jgi:flagellar motor switch protein FliM